MNVETLVDRLRQAHGDNLRAVVVYGSAAAGDQRQGRARDVNILVLVRSLALDDLEREGPVAQAWAKAGNPPPLTLTESEWLESADIFPMEYADVLEHHRVLHGDLPDEDRIIDREHLRLELEQQVMGKLIQLRQGAMAAAGRRGALLELLEASLSTFMVLFRAAVRLHGQRPPFTSEALCQRVADLCGVDPSPFVQVIRHKRGEARLGAADAAALLDRYLTETGKLKAHIDQFATSP
jgi:predicted nucleotidyltransferase